METAFSVIVDAQFTANMESLLDAVEGVPWNGRQLSETSILT